MNAAKIKIGALALLAAAVVVFAGCGSAEDDEAGPAPDYAKALAGLRAAEGWLGETSP